MAKRVFVTGGSGFVGRAVVAELTGRGFAVTALSRGKNVPGATVVRGDVLDRDALTRGMAGCDAVVHLVGIIAEDPKEGVTFQRMHVEATEAVLATAIRVGVRRVVHMSALGARANAACDYHWTKWAAETRVRESGLEWTILRPSLIHGPGGEFMRMEAGWARGTRAPYFFMPYFGRGLLGLGGAGRLQPVYVGDVAGAFAAAIDEPKTIGRAYDLGGGAQMTWAEMHHVASAAIVGRRRPAIAVPAWYAKLLTRVVPRSLLPFNRDQVIMSQEDNTCDLSDFRHDFGWQPMEFETALNAYAKQL